MMADSTQNQATPNVAELDIATLLQEEKEFEPQAYKALEKFETLFCQKLDDKWENFFQLECSTRISELDIFSHAKISSVEGQLLFAQIQSETNEQDQLIYMSVQTYIQQVDLALGGSGSAEISKSPDELSAAELAVFPTICQMFADVLEETLAGFGEVPSVRADGPVSFESLAELFENSQFVQVAINLSYENGDHSVFFLIPVEIMELLKAPCEQDEQDEAVDFAWVKTLSDVVERTPIDLEVLLGKMEMSLARINAFEPGQILEIHTDLLDLPVRTVSGNRLFRADFEQGGEVGFLTVTSQTVDRGNP